MPVNCTLKNDSNGKLCYLCVCVHFLSIYIKFSLFKGLGKEPNSVFPDGDSPSSPPSRGLFLASLRSSTACLSRSHLLWAWPSVPETQVTPRQNTARRQKERLRVGLSHHPSLQSAPSVGKCESLRRVPLFATP